ncbi:uncharacterized protein LTR77_003665 [Saxophila tyrrhenica]|uniref:Uncharacterized protein n=1 Tax=Saxophila tyrrhenica TaxID=1690608 RepID=A0AAV9PE84_9PEZI|nr:hypothetical protein LTR77_003665 [Saxophila tyrrhenica]
MTILDMFTHLRRKVSGKNKSSSSPIDLTPQGQQAENDHASHHHHNPSPFETAVEPYANLSEIAAPEPVQNIAEQGTLEERRTQQNRGTEQDESPNADSSEVAAPPPVEREGEGKVMRQRRLEYELGFIL